MTLRWIRFLTPLAVMALVAAACGGDDADSTTTTTADGGTGGASGRIVISGSSTVEPITARVAQGFGTINPGITISVDGPGTSDGFVLFCNGETDISDASRAIRESEVETCQGNGIDPIEIKVAIDGLSVLTNAGNDAVSCLDYGDIYALLGAESTGFNNWSDANDLASEVASAGLGAGHAPYPDAPLDVTAPGEESGTFDSFVEIVLTGLAEDLRGEDADENPRPDYVASANDNVIIDGISNNPASLGWVGYAFYVGNAETVKAIEIDGGEGCVAPTPETISSGEYPISRPLFIYVDKNRLDAKPELVDFVDYYLSGEGLAWVADAGYVDLDPAEIEMWRANWEARNVGKVD